MTRMISVVDLATGSVKQRPSDTPTLDLPEDFDRETRVAALDNHSHAHYAGLNGATTSRAMHARPLSWRVHGETCLVATGSRPATVSQKSNYKLCSVDPVDRD